MLTRMFREAPNPNLKSEKLEQVILFFLHRANNSLLGRTKLMKMLYYADFDHFEAYDEPITGARYRKLEHGPVPDDAGEAIERMEHDGRIRCRDVIGEGYTQVRCDPVEDVNLDALTTTELDTLHQVVERWAHHSTKRIEAATHGEAPWLAVLPNEIIPYEMAYYRNNFGEMDVADESDEVPAG